MSGSPPWYRGLALVLATACSRSDHPAAAPATPADARAVETVLQQWYDASEHHDSAAYARPLLPSFFIFEDTTRFDGATLVRLVVEGFTQGVDKATLSDFNTQVSGDVAWTSFHNDEVWTPNGGPAEPARRYLETAVFRRVDGAWKIERYHATHINRPATEGH